MTISESHNIKGKLTILKMDSSDRVVEEVRATNDITLLGRKLVAQLFANNQSIKPVDSILIGTGTKDFDPKDNTLAQPIDDFSITLEDSETQINEGKESYELTLVGTLNAREAKVDGKAITEACLYSNDSKVMYNRVTFAPITKRENFKLKMIWQIIF
ncbi:MAG: hypothetical protein F6K39_46430 [Okeania sp. SIO3B3]|nr:hypothetical protein [Okeania sp. SIO3B3]